MANTTLSQSFLSKEMKARKDLDIRTGDTVKVHVKIQEKGKTRTQIFEGLVIATKHGKENGGTFTVRKVSSGVGVERIFPIYAPMIDKIEIVRRARVKQSKLYYIRTKVARQIRRKMRNFVEYFATSADLEIPADEMIEETVEESTEAAENVENSEAPANDTPAETVGTAEQVSDEAPAVEEAEPTSEAVPAESKEEEKSEEAAPAEAPDEETSTDDDQNAA